MLGWTNSEVLGIGDASTGNVLALKWRMLVVMDTGLLTLNSCVYLFRLLSYVGHLFGWDHQLYI